MLWNQPELDLKTAFAEPLANKTGGSIKVDCTFRPGGKLTQPGIYLQMGYKTKGFQTGEVLDKSFILRGGLAFWF